MEIIVVADDKFKMYSKNSPAKVNVIFLNLGDATLSAIIVNFSW
jgi:hypothetical protein